jgi:hypothetical protein
VVLILLGPGISAAGTTQDSNSIETASGHAFGCPRSWTKSDILVQLRAELVKLDVKELDRRIEEEKAELARMRFEVCAWYLQPSRNCFLTFVFVCRVTW